MLSVCFFLNDAFPSIIFYVLVIGIFLCNLGVIQAR